MFPCLWYLVWTAPSCTSIHSNANSTSQGCVSFSSATIDGDFKNISNNLCRSISVSPCVSIVEQILFCFQLALRKMAASQRKRTMQMQQISACRDGSRFGKMRTPLQTILLMYVWWHLWLTMKTMPKMMKPKMKNLNVSRCSWNTSRINILSTIGSHTILCKNQQKSSVVWILIGQMVTLIVGKRTANHAAILGITIIEMCVLQSMPDWIWNPLCFYYLCFTKRSVWTRFQHIQFHGFSSTCLCTKKSTSFTFDHSAEHRNFLSACFYYYY